MQDYIKKYSRTSLVVSILLIVLALFLIFKPNTSLNVIMILVGLALAVNGAYHTFSYFQGPRELKIFSLELVVGIISLLFGLVFICDKSKSP